MDRLYEAACEVESAIEECIEAEQYAEASRLRGVFAEIQEQDDVHNVLDVSSLVGCRPPLRLSDSYPSKLMLTACLCL